MSLASLDLSAFNAAIRRYILQTGKETRAAAYRATVDPITCEIARLRDMGGSAAEIAEAEARREAAVAAIKAQWPYPEGAE